MRVLDMRVIEVLAPLWETIRSIIPLTAIMAFFQLVVLRKPIDNLKEFLLGFILAVLGLHLFLKGATMSLLPLGDSVGRNIHILERRWLIVIIAFIIGYLGTLVEPALKALALEVEELSIGTIRYKVLIHGVAVGFGLGMAIGVTKILLNIPYIKIVVPLLILIVILAFFAPEPFAAIAFDSASATTGPVNIPLNMALAIGLATVIKTVDPLISGFGIIGLTSIGAMISVLVLGIFTKL
ncbi:MAG: DUF1538 domain-containing protein [Alkaliphilus sp.]|nr:DUF1538 domain-containing protein [Alkaliphilus sp.]